MSSRATPPRVTVREVRLSEREVRLRMPFRFGVVTLTESPQIFVRGRPALLHRAVLDAVCRLANVSFFDAMRANLAGMTPTHVAPDLAGFDMDTFLRSLRPLPALHARHTVGLVDPITAADQTTSTRVKD